MRKLISKRFEKREEYVVTESSGNSQVQELMASGMAGSGCTNGVIENLSLSLTFTFLCWLHC